MIPLLHKAGCISVCWILIATPLLADIDEASPAHLEVTRGDKVILDILGDQLDDAKWFAHGQLICKGFSCDVHTDDWTPGEFTIDAVSKDDRSIQAIHFTISVSDSPSLYQPKTIKPDTVGAKNRVTTINSGDPWIAAIQGRLASTKIRTKANVEATIDSPAAAPGGEFIRIPYGSIAVAGNSHAGEELILSSPAELRRINSDFDIRLGQFLWRRLPKLTQQDSSGFSTSSLIHLNATAKLTAEGPGDTYVQFGRIGANQAVDIFAIGSDIHFACADQEILVKASTRSQVVFDSAKGICRIVSHKEIRDRDAVANFYHIIMKRWFGQTDSHFAQFWFKEYQGLVMQRPKDEYMPLAKNLAEAGQWGATIDVFSSSLGRDNPGPDVLYLRGLSRLEVGLYADAERFLKQTRELSPNDGDAAFQLGRLKFAQGKYREALEWFETAISNGYPNLPEAHRRASEAAERQQSLRSAVGHSKAAALNEQDDDKAETDFQNAKRQENLRTFHGQMEGSAEILSHVLPVDPAKYGDLPNHATSNRSPMFGGLLQWQKIFESSNIMTLSVSGDHDFVAAMNSTLSSGSRSNQVVTFRAASQNPKVIGIDTSVSVGTRMSGGERQVDEFGGTLGIIGGSQYIWNLGINQTRSLDPHPGGSDIVDVRLNRLVGDADHSHFEYGLTAEIKGDLAGSGWQANAAYQMIDFRTGIMDDYDATEISVSGGYHRSLSRRWRSSISVLEQKRTYIVKGSDQWLAIDLNATFMMAPHWDFELLMGYFSRTASDDVASYQGHHYGAALNVAL